MRKKVNKKLIVALLSFVLLFGGTFGSSLAWLLDNTEDVTNTFSPSNIEVELDESDDLDLEMIPGWAIDKDPWAMVTTTSEDCYLFIEVTEEGGDITIEDEEYGFDDFIAYAVDTEKWTPLTGTDNVYWMIIDDETEKGEKQYILGDGTYQTYSWADNQVLTKPEVTKEMMKALTTSTVTTPVELPKLSFKAYAVQLWKTNEPAEGATDAEITAAQFSAAEAWAIAKPTNP